MLRSRLVKPASTLSLRSAAPPTACVQQRTRAETAYRFGVSVFVAAVLGAQAATLWVTAQHAGYLRGKLFPILEYPMYAPAHYEGERVTASWLLEAVLSDGRSLAIPREQLQVDIFDFVRIVQSALQHDRAATATLLGLVRERVPGADRIREVRIKNYPVQLTRDGPKPLASEVVMTIPLS
jgi:hypothetical protein